MQILQLTLKIFASPNSKRDFSIGRIGGNFEFHNHRPFALNGNFASIHAGQRATACTEDASKKNRTSIRELPSDSPRISASWDPVPVNRTSNRLGEKTTVGSVFRTAL